MTLAAHAFTSVLPILIVAGALRASADPGTAQIFAEHLGFDEATAEILESLCRRGSRAAGNGRHRRGPPPDRCDLIRAGARTQPRTIWRTPRVSIKFAWRWLAAVAGVIIGLACVVTTRIVVRGNGAYPPLSSSSKSLSGGHCGGSCHGSLSIAASVSESSFPVARRAGFAVAGLFGRVLLPPLFADSANRYGVLGVEFIYIGWLLVLACIFLVASTAGRVGI